MELQTQENKINNKESYRKFLIEWNYNFPADRWWREKYKIPLFSPSHLDQSQLDIALEYYEEIVFNEFRNRGEILKQREDEYSKGIWIGSPKVTIEEEQDLFASLDVMKINNQGGKLQFEE